MIKKEYINFFDYKETWTKWKDVGGRIQPTKKLRACVYIKGVRPWFLNDYGTLLFERDHREVHGL